MIIRVIYQLRTDHSFSNLPEILLVVLLQEVQVKLRDQSFCCTFITSD